MKSSQHPHFKKLAMSNYLRTQYGARTVVREVVLSTDEAAIEYDIGRLLELIDKHRDWWSRTGSVVTVDALNAARLAVLSLLGAIHKPEHRVEYTCAALYGRDLGSLMRAIRAPVARNNNQAALDFRAGVVADRNQFKMLLKSIVLALRQLCTSNFNDTVFRQICEAPRDVIDAWYAQQAEAVSQLDEQAEIDNPDGLAFEQEQNPLVS
jgi:hypothetical protein